MAKGKGGFIGQDGLNAPDAPTGVSGTAGNAQVDVSFTSPSDVGGSAITEYLVTDSTKTHTATGSSSPITVTGLTNGTSYTFNVWAINAFGWSVASDASGGVTPAVPLTALFAGGYRSGYTRMNKVDSINIATTGNATDFGDLSAARIELAGASSSTRCVFGGGINTGSALNIIEYFSFSTAGNATDFGDLTVARDALAGLASSTRGVFAGGNVPAQTNVIDYITIASTGNASDFGDLVYANEFLAGAASSTRGLIGGGSYSPQNHIGYITIASTGNATTFGDLTVGRENLTASANSTRTLFAGGQTYNTIDYVTSATTGNATDFGDLTVARSGLAGSAGNNRGVFAGGTSDGGDSGIQNRIDYVDITTTGNAADFGDLTALRANLAGASSAHGGLS